MRRAGFALLGLVAGYAAGALLGFTLVTLYSPNTHDRAMEAAMTGAFVGGPLLALVGLVVGLIAARRRRPD